MQGKSNLPCNLEIEKHCLASIIKHPKVSADVFPFTDSDSFFNEDHGSIFSVLKNMIMFGKPVDEILLTEKIHAIGLKSKTGISLGDYVHSLCRLSTLRKDKILDYFIELHKYAIARQYCIAGREIEKSAKENIRHDALTIVADAENKFGDITSKFENDLSKPRDLFEGIEEEFEELGNEPTTDGLTMPYQSWEDMFGGLTPGNVYLISAPYKHGKSTLVMDIMRKITGPDVKGLILDTELSYHEVRSRIVSALSGVNEAFIRDGSWRYNAEFEESIRNVWPIVKDYKDRVDHLYVPSMPIDQLISSIRRWKYRNLHGDKKGVVAYDYMKLTGERTSDYWKEYQIMGDKMTKLKDLASELEVPIIAMVQQNMEGQVSLSKQQCWFASTIAKFRKKTPEELETHGAEYGTHILEVDEARHLGKQAHLFFEPVKVQSNADGRNKPKIEYVRNHIYLNVSNFNVEEAGTLRERMDKEYEPLKIEKRTDGKNYDPLL